ncbi:MAG: NUDIX hydrolase [Candidatus Eremiobacteraeota bacterium]|nr:NUDIX hydrolase [Candidatus Eremiobacteraeota bacterium]
MGERPVVERSRRVFEGRVFNVRIDELRYDDGARHRCDVVEHQGSFTIVAAPQPGHVILVRQYRHPAGAVLWELPAGTAEADEDPIAGAARELREETGYRAARIRPLGALYVSPGFCTEIMRFFYAEELSAGEQALDEDERIEVGIFSTDAAWRLVATGEIADIKTVLALLWLEGKRGEIGAGFGR